MSDDNILLELEPDGGAAFPWPGVNAGMSLRDYFAGQALMGLCTMLGTGDADNLANGIREGRLMAGAAYQLADALLAERSKA